MKLTHKTKFSFLEGFGLIEVLVAILVLSVGLLGLINLQIRGHQYSDSARQRAQATYLAYDILDRMRANKDEVDNGTYDLTLGASLSTPSSSDMCNKTTVSCAPDKLAEFDLWEWKQDLSTHLPNGDASIRKNNLIATTDIYEITIQWTRRAFSDADKATTLGTQHLDSIVIETEL